MLKAKQDAGLLITAALGGASGVVISLLLLFGASALVAAGHIPSGVMEEVMISVSFIGAALGSLVAIRKRGKGALTTGLLSGACFLILMLIVVASRKGTGVFSGMTLSVAICAFAAGAFAAAVSARPKKRKMGFSKR